MTLINLTGINYLRRTVWARESSKVAAIQATSDFFPKRSITVVIPEPMIEHGWPHSAIIVSYKRNNATAKWRVHIASIMPHVAGGIVNPYRHLVQTIGLAIPEEFTVDEDCEPFEIVDEDGYHTVAFDTLLRITVPRCMITKMCKHQGITSLLYDPLFTQLRLEISYIHPGRDESIEGTHMIGIADYSNGTMRTMIAERSELLPYDLFNTLNLFQPIAPGFKIKID